MNRREKNRVGGPEVRASRYVARLYSGEMTGQEEDDLFAWLKADPAHRRVYGEVLALWDAAGELRGDPELAAAAANKGARSGGWRTRAGWIAAAAVVLLVAIPVFVTQYLDWPDGAQALSSYATAVGEQRVVTLEDGSRLTLNTGSRVLVDYTRQERRVILDFGEVFFEIEKDPARPMSVSARGRVVTVLGTKFSVLLAGKDVRVAVVEGTVAVSKEDARLPLGSRQTLAAPANAGAGAPPDFTQLVGPGDVILHAGTIATFGDEREQVIENDTDAMQRLQSWRSGVVRFDSEPLYRVVAELNRYSRAKILIEDDTIMNLPISGVFRLERVDLILDALEDVLPIEVVRYSDRYVLAGSNKGDGTPTRMRMRPSENTSR